MKTLLSLSLLFVIVIYVCCARRPLISRSKRAAYDLTDGWYLLINSVNPSFNCQADGYYADIANGCQLYHVCQFLHNPYSKPRFLQYSFICGNGTVFNQLSQTCTFESQLSVPCEQSEEFFHLNDRIGQKINFHSEDDFRRTPSFSSSKRGTFDLSTNRAPQLIKTEKTFAIEDDIEDDNSLDDDFK